MFREYEDTLFFFKVHAMGKLNESDRLIKGLAFSGSQHQSKKELPSHFRSSLTLSKVLVGSGDERQQGRANRFVQQTLTTV